MTEDRQSVITPDISSWQRTGEALAGGSEPPHDGGMEHRVTALETRLDTILPTLATKADIEGMRADLHKNDASIKAWMIATIIALFLGFAGLFFTVSRSLIVPATAPTVIQVPAYPPMNPDGTRDVPGAFNPEASSKPTSGTSSHKR